MRTVVGVPWTVVAVVCAVAAAAGLVLPAGPTSWAPVPAASALPHANPLTGYSWQANSLPAALHVPFGGGLASDPVDHGVVAFGGCLAARCNAASNTTWFESDGVWSEVPTSDAPPARVNASMAWDPIDGYVLLFGGFGCLGAGCTAMGFLNDTWAYKSGTWTPVVPSGATPPAEASAGLAYDPSDKEMVLYGGSACGPTCTTWTYAAGSWTELNLTAQPPPRLDDGFTVDYANDGALLFGGAATSTSVLGDTWLFAHGAWQQFSGAEIPDAGPQARAEPLLAWDAALNAVVLVGGSALPPATAPFPSGSLNETWAFVNSTWVEWPGLAGAGNGAFTPGSILGAGLAADPESGVLVLLGGCAGSCAALQPWGFGPVASVTLTANPTGCARVLVAGADLADAPAGLGLQNGSYPLAMTACHGYQIANVSASPNLTLNASSQNSTVWNGTVVVRGAGQLSLNLSRAPSSGGATGLAAIDVFGLNFLELLLIGVALGLAAIFLVYLEVGNRRRRRARRPPEAKPPAPGGF